MAKKMNRPVPTDDEIRSMNTVKTAVAARYLGISWWRLTDLLQKGTVSFGVANLCPGGTWRYTIWGEKLYKYKNGIDQSAERQMQELAQKADALADEIRQFNAYLARNEGEQKTNDKNKLHKAS